MPNKTEGMHPGEFLVSEAPGRQSRDVVTVLGGENLVAGTVIGAVSVGAAVAAPAAGNTGNGLFGAVALGVGVKAGVYQLVCIQAVANAGKFTVEDPTGVMIGEATVGVAFNAGGLQFTIADGAVDFAPGDSFILTVAAGSGKYRGLTPDAVDGSTVAAGIIFDNVDATTGDTPGVAMKRNCEVNANEINFGTLNADQITVATAQLTALGIMVRPAI